ncbi:TraB/GumN family protein [Altererythrobacter aquiaggeris]|uniref:TraB/GumN family protein n=1 Tax=Aestuarierythrobacter aquiaggeris TaxID=1898396 RepID=UPI0030198F72
MTRLTRKFAGSASALALLFALPACAQTQQLPTPVETTRVAAETVEMASIPAPSGPALWQLADDDTTIYLFGTVHALPKDVEWLKDDVATALSSSDKLVTEIMMTPDIPQRMQALISTKALLPEGQTLRGLLNDDQRASYDAAMTKIGLPPATFDQFEPWFAAMNLAMIPLQQQGYDAETGVEKVLEKNAGAKMERGELETVEFQISVFDELPLDSQVKFLIETAENVDEIKPMLDKMVAEWVEGDAEALAVLMNDSMTDPVLADRLLYARNGNWAEWIDNRMDQPGTIFIAVGAGHLAGDKSVQDLLAARGFKVIRVQ